MRIFYLFLLSFISLFTLAQNQLIVVGTANTTNTVTTYPAPYGNWYWGAKHQFLIRASELTAAGMSAGNINSLAFDVVSANGTPLQNFTISIAQVTNTDLQNGFISTALTIVSSATSYTDVAGWNTHVFSSPFYWDGTSNLLIETCFNNSSFTQNTVFNLTNTSFAASTFYFSDNSSVCAATATYPSTTTRPVMQFDWTPDSIPPMANFSSNNSSCSGSIQFTDLSSGQPTSWQWDFGDGNTSTQQNPLHIYSASGTYTVTLIACNQYGCDTLVMPNYITINLNPNLPVNANCYPATINGTLGFGITNVSLNTINNPSADASAGYEDFTCLSTNLTVGQNYTLLVTHDQPANHNCAAWIDWNNDGVFDDINERILTVTSALTSSVSFFVPPTAVMNTPLRLRISADYDFSAAPTPCSNLDYGQAEDYTVIVNPNNNPPDVAFTADVTYSCDGTVQFTDLTQNLPQTWAWDFGDGNTSNIQNPTHTYTSNGTYTVTLICTNANGSDTAVYTNYITVNTAGAVSATNCYPQTTSYCCGYGTYQVTFNTINNISNDASEGYQDFSCAHQTTVYAGNTYSLSVKTGVNNPQDTRVWIDWNNDGTFSSSELILDAPNDYNPSAAIYIPPGGIVLNTPLRMRVRSDIVGTPKTACDAPLYGQIEDYAVIVDTLPTPPVADFTSDIRYTCSDSIRFFDLSTNNPTAWNWSFGDGNTSTLQNPVHKYALPGAYNVSLTASNTGGSNATIKYGYIVVNCDTAEIPDSGNVTNTNCNGVIFDDGRGLNYHNNIDGSVTIQPSGATSVQLQFLSFNFSTGDSLLIYNAANTNNANLIGAFSGNSLPPTIISATGIMTVREKTNGNTTASGFLAEWTCSNSIREYASTNIHLYPNPTTGVIHIQNATGKPVTSVSIYTILGEHIATVIPLNNTVNLNRYNLSEGIYLIQVNEQYFYKITKK